MEIKSETAFSIAQAQLDFSKVAYAAAKNGEAVIFQEDKPKYLVIDMDGEKYFPELTDDEKIDIISKRVLKKYLPAFKELAK